jgi:hypothetical protein
MVVAAVGDPCPCFPCVPEVAVIPAFTSIDGVAGIPAFCEVFAVDGVFQL